MHADMGIYRTVANSYLRNTNLADPKKENIKFSAGCDLQFYLIFSHFPLVKLAKGRVSTLEYQMFLPLRLEVAIERIIFDPDLV